MAKAKNSAGSEGYQRFKADIKSGSFQGIYVFYGEESYLLENYKKQMKQKLVSGPAEDFNYHRFSDEDFSLESFSEAVEAIPMMGEYSLVELVNINLFGRSESDRSTMAEIFESLPEYCVILLVYDTMEWKPDKRMKKLWSAMEPRLLQVEFSKQPESQLIPWIHRHLSTMDKTMSDDLCRYLILQTGGSMTVLAAELQKLMCYTDQHEICRKDIDDVVIPVMEAAIFDITKDISRKDFDSALLKLQTLLRQDEEPISVNAVIGRQLRQLYGAKVLQEHRGSAYDLCQLYGIRDFAARELFSQAGRFRKAFLRKAMLLSAKTDYALKTSGGNAEELLQIMILQLAEACREGR